MNNPFGKLDFALLADGVLWHAANAKYESACAAAADDVKAEPAMRTARDAVSGIRGRILKTPAFTEAGMAIKLAIFASSGLNDSPAENAAYRAGRLAELIAEGCYEEAAALSLAIDLAREMRPLAQTAAASTSPALARKVRARHDVSRRAA